MKNRIGENRQVWNFLRENPDYIISVFVLIFTVAGMQFKKMRFVLTSLAMANVLLALQCIVGGTVSTGAVVILATVQTVVCFDLNEKKIKVPKWLTVLFMVGTATVVFWSKR